MNSTTRGPVRVWVVRAAVLAACVATAWGCTGRGRAADEGRKLTVTTSWLAAAVKDVTGDAFEIVSLCPPGSCPGHFDMKPSQLADVRESRLLLRFDFQDGLDVKLARLRGEGLRVVSVPAGEGLCIPETYLSACRVVSRAVSTAYPELSARCTRGVADTSTRLEMLTAEVRHRMKTHGLVGQKALTSPHQEAFARWLELEVVGTFRGSDRETARTLAGVIARGETAGVAFVVANRQEGDQQARALAKRLGARLVVFGNFPNRPHTQHPFDALVRDNVNRLLKTANP